MKLSRRFYDSSLNFKNVSIEYFVLCIVLGLASAFTIYGFFYVIRESFRVMTFGFEHFPNIISESDRNLYNIFFAGLSLVFANSIVINLFFSKPENLLSLRNPKRKRILNDQIFLSFNFAYWFTKMSLVFGVFSMCCIDFNFSEYIGFSYLLVFVLYLESWKELSTLLGKNRYKFQLLHLIIMVLLTLGLSRLDFINYKTIDKLAIKSNPIYDLPHSDFYDNDNNKYHSELTIKFDLVEKGNLRFLVFGKWAYLNDIPSIIAAERTSMREELTPFLKVRIFADRDVKIKYIKILEAELYSVGQQSVIYEVYNKEIISRRFESRGIHKRINKSILNFKEKSIPDYQNIIAPPFPMDIYDYHLNDTLNISIDKEIKLNSLVISKKDLAKELRKHINPNTLFIYNFNNDTNYQDYINVLSAHYLAVKKLREQKQTIYAEHENEKNETFRKEQRTLKQQFPILIIEKNAMTQ